MPARSPRPSLATRSSAPGSGDTLGATTARLTTNERLKATSMPDYGHPLRFATFIGPTTSPPSRPVELAQLSERLGFDFVTFQDHPYQSSFLDTWTLLSWVAARTDRIGVSGNCLLYTSDAADE